MNNKISSITQWWRIDAAGLVALALITALCYFGLIRPALMNREAYDQRQPYVLDLAQQVQSDRATVNSMQAELDRIQDELDRLPLRLGSSSGVNSRLADISELASEVGLKVHKMLPDTVRSGRRYDIVPIALSGSGQYAEVKQFMQSIHDDFADVSVVEFTLNSDNNNPDGARFDIGLAWYTLPVLGLADN